MSHSKAIRRVGIRKLAELLGHRNPTTVQGWAERNSIPTEHWSDVVQVTQGTETPITVGELLPPELKDAAA